MNYLTEYLQILVELAEKSETGEVRDEALFDEIAKVPGFHEYLENHENEIARNIPENEILF